MTERRCRWLVAVCGLVLAASALAPLYGDTSAIEGLIEALREFSTGADKDTVNNLLGYGAPHAFGLLVGAHHLIVLRRGRPMREIEIAAALVVLGMAAGAVAAWCDSSHKNDIWAVYASAFPKRAIVMLSILAVGWAFISAQLERMKILDVLVAAGWAAGLGTLALRALPAVASPSPNAVAVLAFHVWPLAMLIFAPLTLGAGRYFGLWLSGRPGELAQAYGVLIVLWWWGTLAGTSGPPARLHGNPGGSPPPAWLMAVAATVAIGAALLFVGMRWPRDEVAAPISRR